MYWKCSSYLQDLKLSQCGLLEGDAVLLGD